MLLKNQIAIHKKIYYINKNKNTITSANYKIQNVSPTWATVTLYCILYTVVYIGAGVHNIFYAMGPSCKSTNNC